MQPRSASEQASLRMGITVDYTKLSAYIANVLSNAGELLAALQEPWEEVEKRPVTSPAYEATAALLVAEFSS